MGAECCRIGFVVGRGDCLRRTIPAAQSPWRPVGRWGWTNGKKREEWVIEFAFVKQILSPILPAFSHKSIQPSASNALQGLCAAGIW